MRTIPMVVGWYRRVVLKKKKEKKKKKGERERKRKKKVIDRFSILCWINLTVHPRQTFATSKRSVSAALSVIRWSFIHLTLYNISTSPPEPVSFSASLLFIAVVPHVFHPHPGPKIDLFPIFQHYFYRQRNKIFFQTDRHLLLLLFFRDKTRVSRKRVERIDLFFDLTSKKEKFLLSTRADYARPRRRPKSQTTDRHNFRSLGLHRSATPGSGARSQPRMGWITSGLSSTALSSAASRSPFAYTSPGSWCVGLQSLPPQHRAKISQTAWTKLWWELYPILLRQTSNVPSTTNLVFFSFHRNKCIISTKLDLVQ